MREPIYIVITTYKRLDTVIRLIKGIKDNLYYPDGELKWCIIDDGSGEEYMKAVRLALPADPVFTYDSNRKGVGHGMNKALEYVRSVNGKLILLLEDDWVLRNPTDFSPYADVMVSHESVGYIRMGYISVGLEAEAVGLDGRLWWKVKLGTYQYNYTGHAGLRHIRFYDFYGDFAEGLPPGQTELDMCAKVNKKSNGPDILIPMNYECQWGIFDHIGSESLANVGPE